MTEDQRILALPSPPGETNKEEWQKRILSPAGQLGLAPLSAALKSFRADRQKEIRRVVVNGTPSYNFV